MLRHRRGWYFASTVVSVAIAAACLPLAACHRSIPAVGSHPAQQFHIPILSGWSVKNGAEQFGDKEPAQPFVIQSYRKDHSALRLRFLTRPASRYNKPPTSMKELVIKIVGERSRQQSALKLSSDALREIQAHEVRVGGYPGYYTYDWWRKGPSETYQRMLRFATPDAMYVAQLTVDGKNITPETRAFAAATWAQVTEHWHVLE